MKIKCHHCGHVWKYQGNSKFYIMCPSCKYKKHISKIEIVEDNDHSEIIDRVEEEK